VEDREILDCIHALVAQQRRLRDRYDAGDPVVDHDRLAEIGRNLEQMWELLRRRRAQQDGGAGPATIDLRSPVRPAAPA
jgi:Protein of unknown function (DUF2630)